MEPDIPELQKWLTSRENGIKQLRLLVIELNKYQKSASVSGVAGRLTAIGAALFGMGALASGGAILLPALAGLSGVGAVVTGKVVRDVATKSKLDEVQNILDEDRKCSENIESVSKTVEKVDSDIAELLENRVKDKLKKNMEDTCEEDDEIASPGDKQGSNISCFHLENLAKSLCRKDQEKMEGLPNVSKFANKLIPGINIARHVNFLNVQKFMNMGKSAVTPVFKIFPKLGNATVPTAGNVASTGKNILQLGNVLRYGGVVISLALLPVEVYNLVQDSLALHRGDCHEASKKVEDQIENLEMEMKRMKEFLCQKIRQLNNFVMLLNSILSDGCGEDLGRLIIQILKVALVLKPIVKAFDRFDIQTHPPFTEERELLKLSAVLVNCERTDESFYKRLSTFIWCAWKMGNNTAVFLQNTALQDDPVLWTLFGVSVNSFDSVHGQGVSILLPANFSGDIHSVAEYQANNDWNGRCLIVNVTHLEETYSLVSVLAPDEKDIRDLFMREIAVFVKRNARGKILMGANFTCELQTMTVIVKTKVSKKVPISLIKRLIPFKEVCEYITDEHKLTEDPFEHTSRVLEKYTLMNSDDIDIQWKFCTGTQLTIDNHGDQIKPLLDLGLISLWKDQRKADTGKLGFSTENEICHRVVSCSQNLDFFLSSDEDKKLERCYLDHTLRFLDFLTQSALFVEDV